MKQLNLIGIFVLVFSVAEALAQAPPQTPPAPNQAEQMRQARMREEQARRLNQQGMARLRAINAQLYRGVMVPKAIIKDVRELYGRPTDKELKTLEPMAEDYGKYRSFLTGKSTGIVRLIEDAGCGDSTKTLSAAPECIKYPVPGHGSWFSFREGNYRLSRLSDLGFGNGNFFVSSVHQHAILTGIGDVPLEEVRLNSKGLKYLNDFVPADNLSEAVRVGYELRNKVEKDGYLYAQELRAVEGMTYLLRSVAYRGNLYRSIGGITYDELDFDKRFDITVAFRIVRKHDDGSITLLWKEISRKASPVLRREKGGPVKMNGSKFLADKN